FKGFAFALADIERNYPLETRFDPRFALVLAGHRVGAGNAFHIMQGELEARLVAQREEAWRGNGKCHRITHDHVFGSGADLVTAPRHGREPYRAIEIRQLKFDLRRAVATDLDDTGEESQRRLHRRTAHDRHAPRAIPTGAQGASLGAHTIDQPAIDIADLGAEPALPEEPILWLRGLEARQIEDADVGRRNGDARLLT